MLNASLSPFQIQILKILTEVGGQWRLTGGGALIVAYTHHRQTEDLDLFFKSKQLAYIPREVQTVLENHGLEVTVLQDTMAFARLEIRSGTNQVIVDLVADPVPTIEEPVFLDVDGVKILLDTEYEILVNKLCALLSRSEVRDLIDMQVLLAKGYDLNRALKDAAEKDSGFSALTLAWVLQGFPLKVLANALNMPTSQIDDLEQFRLSLIQQLTR